MSACCGSMIVAPNADPFWPESGWPAAGSGCSEVEAFSFVSLSSLASLSDLLSTSTFSTSLSSISFVFPILTTSSSFPLTLGRLFASS